MTRIEPSILIAVEASPIRAGQAISQTEKPAGEALVQPAELSVLTNGHLVGRSSVSTVEALRVRRLDNQEAS
jgi:hypothetical protein